MGAIVGKPYISVLERNMSNPEYRKQLEQQQALESTHPEALLAGVGPAMRAGLSRLKKPAPRVREVKIGENVLDDPRVWKHVAPGPSAEERLNSLRKQERSAGDYLKIQAANESIKNANRRAAADSLVLATQSPEENSRYKKGGVVAASKRADGCAQRGKTRGKMV